MNKLQCTVWLAAFINMAMCQFITFDKSGRLGVNFGGYHAGIGMGADGLFAEAGTPTGQNAKAGLGGVASKDGAAQGGLFAEANAGGGIGARAGLGGSADSSGANGAAFAHSSAGGKHAAAGIGGETNAESSTGYKYATSTKVVSEEGPTTHVVVPSTTYSKPHVEYSSKKDVHIDNEIKKTEENTVEYDNVNLLTKDNPTAVPAPAKPQEGTVIYKRIRKPHLHHKHVYATPVVVERSDVPPPPPAPAHGTGGEVVYTKTISAHRNPTFFADIFNIPISTLGAVSKFLGGAASTNIAVEKRVHANAGVNGGLDKAGTIQSEVTVQSDKSPSSFIDGVFSIPINTLQAVNKFLENNVPARKQVVVTASGETVSTVPHLSRAAKRRALRKGYKETVIVEQPESES